VVVVGAKAAAARDQIKSSSKKGVVLTLPKKSVPSSETACFMLVNREMHSKRVLRKDLWRIFDLCNYRKNSEIMKRLGVTD
jgi:hypothetical protein